MPIKYELSRNAARDLDHILDYSVTSFGAARTEKYYASLATAFSLIGDNPRIGRDYGHVKAGYRRFDCESHVIYYKITDTRVLILRILSETQDPARHL